MQVTGEKHYIVEPAYELLAKNMTKGDVLLSDVIQKYNEIAGEKLHPMEEISYYGYVLDEDNSPLTVIKNYSRGWIAVSPNAKPRKFGLIEDDFEYAGKSVDYIGLEGEVYVWRWGSADK